MTELQVNAHFAIHDGKLAEFKELAAKCMTSVREKDTGTLKYDWFFSADETECVVRETYKDSASIFEHIGNLGDLLGALTGTADMTLECYGNPSAELVAATEPMGVKFYSHFQSK